MRSSQLLIPTLREAPTDAEVASHILLVRGGFIRRLTTGAYTWLPLGLRVLKRIEAIVREELVIAGAQEVLMPVVQPAELWRESGRWDTMGPEMLRFTDRHEREYCLSPTQEEVVTDLFRRVVTSYRQLPCNFYHIQTKFRDEIRPRFGLMRAREFLMKDGYSFHLDDASFEAAYSAMHDCYSAILRRLALDFRAVEADPGAMGDGDSHEFHVLAGSGEDVIAFSPASDYAANLEKAEAPVLADDHPVEPLATVPTRGMKTIAEVSEHLRLPASRCAKTLIVHADSDGEGPSLAALVVRGDHELSEAKAVRLQGIRRPLTFATDAEIKSAIGASPGSLGPVGLSLPIIADGTAAAMTSFVCGANEDDRHHVGVNWERDVGNVRVADIREALPDDMAADGSGTLEFRRGIEVGHIFKLGDKYTRSMGVSVQDRDGRSVTPIMGCYGFGVSRAVAAVVEQCHDERGIVWPESIAPFTTHIVALTGKRSTAVEAAAARLYEELTAAGVDVLLDDRDERPGVKFADADLIGIPHRVTVGERGLKNGIVEYARRDGTESRELALDEAVAHLARARNAPPAGVL